jgi:hypothetical protein
MKAKKSISCGDWHLSWGFSTNKIGTLTMLGPNEFIWKGRSQGRHGQKWNTGAKLHFTVDADLNIDQTIEEKGSYPRWSEVKKAIVELQSNQ